MDIFIRSSRDPSKKDKRSQVENHCAKVSSRRFPVCTSKQEHFFGTNFDGSFPILVSSWEKLMLCDLANYCWLQSTAGQVV